MTPAERLRRPHYVYRLYDAGMGLLYLGSTYSPEKRIREHRSSPWFASVAHIQTSMYGDAIEAMRAEAEAHIAERPRHSRNPSVAIAWAESVLSEANR